MQIWSLRIKVIILLMILNSLTGIKAQDIIYRTINLEPEHIDLQIHCSHSTSDGLVWFGTNKGVYRYDGSKLQFYPPSDTTLQDLTITAIYEDKKSQLWIASKSGNIFRLIDNQLQKVDTPNINIGRNISSITEDLKGNIWCGTLGAGILLINNNRISNFTIKNGLPDDYIYSIVCDEYGKIWAATDRGIIILKADEKLDLQKKINTSDGLPDNIIKVLSLDKNGKIWAGAYENGLSRINPLTYKIEYISEEWKMGEITTITPLGNSLYVGTEASGLILLEEKTKKDNFIISKTSLKGRKITWSSKDQQGNIWVIGDRNIYLIDPSLRKYDYPEKLKHVYAIYPGKQLIWIATDKGVFSFNPNNSSFIKRINSLRFPVTSLTEDLSGNIWLGSFGDGILRLDPNTGAIEKFTTENGMINNNVLSLSAGKNTIWMTTLGGISYFNPFGKPEFKLYSNNSPKTSYVYDVFVSDDDTVWFATDGEGIIKSYKNLSQNIKTNQLKPVKVCYAIREYSGQTGFLTSAQGILVKNKHNDWSAIYIKNGIREQEINGFSIGSNYLLATHKKGIDIKNLQTGRWKYFDYEYGIQKLDLYYNSVRTDNEEKTWIASSDNLLLYDNKSEASITFPVSQLTNIQLFNQDIDSTTRKFSHDENHLTFQFCGLWYHEPKNISYQIMLDGYDSKWENTRNTSAVYSNLQPGNYTFKVRSGVGNNFENASIDTYTFSIRPPFYKTAWFILLTSFSLFLFLFLIVKQRDKLVLQKEKQKQDEIKYQLQTLKSQINPHFLFNSFSTLINEIETNSTKAVEYVEHLSDFFRHLLNLQDKNLIPLQEEITLVENYIFLQMKRYSPNLTVNMNIKPELLSLQIPPLTLQLLVENAIKHNIISSSKPLEIKIFCNENFLIVENALQKKRTREVSTGIGLQNITERYKLLTNLPVKIEDTSNTFKVTIPLI